MLGTQPDEFLKLRIGFAAMVGEPSKVTLSALPDLKSSFTHFTIQDIWVLDIFGDQTDELSDCDASFKSYQSLKTIIPTIGCTEDLDGCRKSGSAEKAGETFASVDSGFVGLYLAAQATDIGSWYGYRCGWGSPTRVIGSE